MPPTPHSSANAWRCRNSGKTPDDPKLLARPRYQPNAGIDGLTLAHGNGGSALFIIAKPFRIHVKPREIPPTHAVFTGRNACESESSILVGLQGSEEIRIPAVELLRDQNNGNVTDSV